MASSSKSSVVVVVAMTSFIRQTSATVVSLYASLALCDVARYDALTTQHLPLTVLSASRLRI